MEYVIIGACIVVAIAGGIVLYVKNKRTKMSWVIQQLL